MNHEILAFSTSECYDIADRPFDILSHGVTDSWAVIFASTVSTFSPVLNLLI